MPNMRSDFVVNVDLMEAKQQIYSDVARFFPGRDGVFYLQFSVRSLERLFDIPRLPIRFLLVAHPSEGSKAFR